MSKPVTKEEGQTIVEEKVVKFNGDICIKKYLKGKFLGKGGFAKCYELMNEETKYIHACKLITKASLQKSRAKQKLMSEIKIHRSLKHHHVCQFTHFFEDKDNVYILLELCTNQSLNDLLKRRKRLHELEVQCYTLQIVSALKYLHSNRVIHRDLKLGNLFLNDKMEIKVGDFGLATKLDFDGERKRTICGTPNYIAPEVLEGKGGHSYEVDIWSLGVIIYTLIIGKPPFETTDVKATYKRIKENNYSFPEHVPISDQAKTLISSILCRDPQKRPDLDEIIRSDFLMMNAVPKTLPQSFLACPPSQQYIRQFKATAPAQKSNYASAQYLPRRMEQSGPTTASGNPRNLLTQGSGSLNVRGNVPKLQTDKMGQEPDDSNPPLSSNRIPASGRVANTGSLPRMQTAAGSAHQIVRVRRPAGTAVVRPGSSTKDLQPKVASNVWVQRWIDYSSKYGLGYLLSEGSSGVFFNDSTKIVAEPNSTHFFYYERKAVSATEKQDVLSKYNFSDYPRDLNKKVTLLDHFKSYLQQNNVQQSSQPPQDNPERISPPGSVYVKKWMRTAHATMFRLSNKIVQVNFKDHTEILLNSESRIVTYVNKRGERQVMPLSQALDSNDAEMTKRLKYTKDILTTMLNNGSSVPSQNQQNVPSR